MPVARRFEEVVTKTQASNAVIYTVALVDPVDRDANPGLLRRIAQANGGEAFAPRNADDITEVLQRIARDIRHTYTLGYVSTNNARDGAFRQIRLIVQSPDRRRLVVRTRSGYLAGAAKAPEGWRCALSLGDVGSGSNGCSWEPGSSAWCGGAWCRFKRRATNTNSEPSSNGCAWQRLPSCNASAVLPTGSLIGSLDIPRLGLSAVIAEGDDDATLKVAIGHLPDTPLPWHDGNSALAGHRDTFFRPLQHIRVGDELRVSTARGDFRYQVRETMVVGPNDVWVLDPTDRPMLTLITCYPFSYVGKAPRRFIVRAERPIAGNSRS